MGDLDNVDASFLAVAQAIAAHLEHVPPVTDEVDAAAQHLRLSAQQAVPRPGFTAVPGRDHSAILAPAVAAGLRNPASAIAAAIAALPGALPWHYHYAPRPGEAALAERIGFAELIGPNGPLTAPECRVGFTLMAPGTFYPLHAHPAIELYLVISGTSGWTTPGAVRIVAPGQFVLHRSNQPHAMRTFGQPLLALYGWRGDIHTSSYYL